MSSERRLERVEARIRSLEQDLSIVRTGGRLRPVRPAPSSASEHLRQVSLWQACVVAGSALVVAAIVVALL